jgi:cytochrome c biogenesis protein CcmG/thiol:disulfide interchange protein DsbE
MQLRYVLPVVLVLGLLAVLGVGLTLDPSKVPSPLIDKPAPAYNLPRLHQPDQLISQTDLLGQVHLVNVWASWCVACREEHAQIKQLASDYQVTIIGLNYKDERSDALAWLQQFGDPYTAIAVDADGRVGIDWGVYGVPETFLVDPQGRIRYKHIGPIRPDDVHDVILPKLRALMTGNS